MGWMPGYLTHRHGPLLEGQESGSSLAKVKVVRTSPGAEGREGSEDEEDLD
jgi:hypothetical protein